MFKAERRFKDTRPWEKDHSLDSQFKELSDDYDIYIIRHWFYCMATAPMTVSFGSKDGAEKYLKNQVGAGDFIEVWAFVLDSDLLKPKVSAKMPDGKGLIPTKGAY